MDPPELKDILIAIDVLQLRSLERIQLADVRRSFCQAVKRGHPDKVGGSTGSFNEVMQAYNTLTRYFKNKHDEGECAGASSCAYRQSLSIGDMVFSEPDSAYFFQCRCGEVLEVPTAALALDIRQYTCTTCSLVYRVEHD